MTGTQNFEENHLWPETIEPAPGKVIFPDKMAGELESLAAWVNQTGRDKGFWDEDVDTSDGIKLCKMYAEISEAFEALRKGNPASKKIDGYSQVEEELADTVILIFDYCREHGFDIGAAIISKAIYNMGRPRLNGEGKLF
jgi:NTP pyrophosphatase (non-canonical NTP hydrolase)